MNYLIIEDTYTQVENLKRRFNIHPEDKVTVARDLSYLIDHIKEIEQTEYDVASFDFDLGGGFCMVDNTKINNNGEMCLEYVINHNVKIKNYLTHSMNCVGRERIIARGKDYFCKVFHVLVRG